MGNIIHQADADLKDCEGIKDDIDKIEHWATIFDNRILLEETIYLNVLRNYKALGADIFNILVDIHNGEYKRMGVDMADVLVNTLKPLDATREDPLNLY